MGIDLLEPKARPVDTFVQAPESPLSQFAKALEKISPALREFQDQRAAKQAKDDEALGEARFWTRNKDAATEATARGLIPPQDNPHFVAGWKKAEGNAYGEQLQRQFMAGFEAWDGKNSEDPKAYEEWFQTFVATNLEQYKDDPEVLRNLMPHIQQLDGLGNRLYTQYRSEATVSASLNAHMSVALGAIDKGDEQGKSVPEGTNYKAVNEAIALQRQDFVESGGNPDLWDKTMADAMALKVLTTRDEGLLKWFDETVPGKDYTYGSTPYGAKVKAEAQSSLEVIKRQSVVEEKAAQEAADKKAKGDAERNVLEFFAADVANISKPVPDGLMQAGVRADPTFRARVAEWRNNMSKGFSDPDAIKEVYADINQGGGVKAVTDAMSNGVFGDMEDYTKAYNFAKGFEENKDKIGQVMSSGPSQSLLKDFDVKTKGKNTFDGSPIDGMSDEGREAQYDFRRAVTDWVVRNPNATPQEIDEATAKIGKSILDRIIVEGDPNDPMAPGGQYDRPANAPFDNPYTDKKPSDDPSAEGAPAPGQEAAPVEPPATDPVKAEDAKTLIDGLTPEQKTAMEERAKGLGLDLDAFVNTYVIRGTPEAASKPSPAEDNRSFLERFKAENQGMRGNYDLTPQSADPNERIQVDGAYNPNEIQQARPRGMDALVAPRASLVTSNKRGSAPDVERLKPEVVTGVVSLQKAWGRNLPVVSGFRDKRRNAKAGGASKSQHMHGNAVDIDVSDLSKAEQVKLIELASSQGFLGIGVYGGSLHLDYGGRRAWGPSFHSDSIPPWARSAIAKHMSNTSAAAVASAGPGFTPDEAMGFLDEANAPDPVDIGYPGAPAIEDPTAQSLASIIYSREGGGNYNAVAGNAGSKRDLSGMTLNQVLATQVAAKGRGVKSTAVGAAQFIHGTLKSLKKELGLSGNEPFTPALQDKLFVALLNRRGFQLYKAGKITKRQFAFRLSQEWAALANPYTGKSYYDGEGNNKAGAKASEVYAALGI